MSKSQSMESIEKEIVARVEALDNEIFVKYSKDITIPTIIEAIAFATQRGERECILTFLGNFAEVNQKLCLRLVEYTNLLMYGDEYEGNRKYIIKWVLTNNPTQPPAYMADSYRLVISSKFNVHDLINYILN
jgi:hypothetical protein